MEFTRHHLIKRLLIPLLLACPLKRGDAAEEVLYEQPVRARPIPIVIPTNFDGVMVPLVFDTGCHVHLVDPSLHPHFGPYIARMSSETIGDSIETKSYRAPEMAIGTWKLPNSTMNESDCKFFERSLGFGVKGFLGIGPFRNVAIDVNFDQQRFRFLQNYKSPAAATLLLPGQKLVGMKYIPVEPNPWGQPYVRVIIDGVVVSAAMDTAGILSIGLRTETFEKLVASGTITRNSDTYGSSVRESVAGLVPIRRGKFTKGRVLGIDLNGIEVDDTKNIDILGFLFLLNFNFVYDAVSQTLYFERRQGEPPLDYQTMMGAMFIYSEGDCSVSSLQPEGGPARDAGIREGDKILRIGQLRGNQLNGISVYDLCATCAGQAIEVEYSRGDQKETMTTRLKLREKEFVYPPQP